MKKEEKQRLQNEIANINQSIRKEENEIRDTPEYKKTEEAISRLMEGRRDDSTKHEILRREVYNKYGLSLYRYYGVRLSDIKPSVKQGIKVGLGMTNVKSVEDNIVKIVKEMIAEDLKDTKIENLKQEILKVDDKIKGLMAIQNKLIKDRTDLFIKKQNKIYDELYNKKATTNKKLEGQKKEVTEKMKTLPQHLPKIIKEVNKRLILDGVSG